MYIHGGLYSVRNGSHVYIASVPGLPRQLVAGLGEGPYYLSSAKLVAVSHRFDWKSCFCQVRKTVIGPKPPTVRQAFLVDCGEAEAYHARRR